MSERARWPGLELEFDGLRPPPDLATARARLRAVADQGGPPGALPGIVHHLGSPTVDRWPDLAEPARIVVADTVLWRASQAQIADLGRAMTAGRVLLFLEPTADLGWRAAGHRLGRTLWQRACGHHFQTDVPEVLRRVGLIVTDINRFGLGPWGVRSYVMGRAERIESEPSAR